MKKIMLVSTIVAAGCMVSACGDDPVKELLATKINSFKASIAAVDQVAPVTIAANTDIKLEWNVSSAASTYNANLYVSSTTTPGATPLVVKVSNSTTDSVTCKTDKTVPTKTLMSCTGFSNVYDVTGFVGGDAHIILQVTGVNAATATSTIAVKIQ